MRTSSSSTKSRGWALSWRGSSSAWSQILRLPPRQNRIENEGQKNQSQREADIVAKVLGDVVLHHDADGDVHQRNEVEQNPPGRLAGDLAQHDDIIDRDDARPTRLARLFNTFHKLAISNTTRDRK